MFNNLTAQDNASSIITSPNHPANQWDIARSDEVAPVPSGHVLITRTRWRLGDGNRVGSRKSVLQSTIETSVECLLVPLLAHSALPGPVQGTKPENIIIGLHRPVSVPLIHDSLALISVPIHETTQPNTRRPAVLFHRSGTPPPFVVSTIERVPARATAGDKP